MNEPVITNPSGTNGGNQSIAEEQYRKWLDDMTPFLRAGNTLWYAMDKCMLLQHKTAIYAKYRQNDWFAEKINALRATIGELANNITFKLLEKLHVKIIDGGTMTKEDFDVLKLVAEKHRSAQPFFVSRTETAQVDENKVGKILDNLESQNRYDDLGTKMKEATAKTQTETLQVPLGPLQP